MAAKRPLAFDPIEEAAAHWAAAGWGEAAAGMALVTSVVRAQQIFMARADAVLGQFGLTFARFEVLMLLRFARKGELPLGKIGERLQVHPASVTNAIDRLEASGLVERVPHPTDGRTTLARLTPEGEQRSLAAAKALNHAVFESVGVPSRQIDSTVRALANLRRDAGDFETR
jgi:DNA-binding MarR family transcriptional regulator